MINDDFMLKGETAKILYNDIAKDAPIYDFHCHLSAKEIYEDRVFRNISKIFLESDHYKWRAMRYAGIPEKYITGSANDLDKFKIWAKTCERLIGSPLYHWTNMELKKFFGIKEILKEGNAEKIYEHCNNKIAVEALSPVKFINNSKVRLICTTDDPSDNLEYHKLLTEKKELGFKVLPTFRPDKALNILDEAYMDYLTLLSENSSVKITSSYSTLIEVLKERIDYFDKAGCKLSDHSLENVACFSTTYKEVEEIFKKRLYWDKLSFEDAEKFKFYTLKLLAKEYKKKRMDNAASCRSNEK